jgi:hypothetical protein
MLAQKWKVLNAIRIIGGFNVGNKYYTITLWFQCLDGLIQTFLIEQHSQVFVDQAIQTRKP